MMEEIIEVADEEPYYGSLTISRSGVNSLVNSESMSSNINRHKKTFTVEEAVEAAGLGWFQLRIIIICGILSGADAMEMLLLSVLGPALRCEWQLQPTQIAFITTVVFLGYLIGSPMWGVLSDKYGRWKIFSLVLCIISYFGFVTAFSPNFFWLVLLRGLVGFGIGGGSTGFTLLSEYLPSKHRAKVLIAFQFSWAVGSTFEITLAYFILPTLGWRWLVGYSSLPIGLFLLLLRWLPESARYQLAAGQCDKAMETITSMFYMNRKPMPEGTLSETPVSMKSRGNFGDIFSIEYRRTTLTLISLWFTVAFTYYGVILISTEFFRFHSHCFADTTTIVNPDNKTDTFIDNSCCISITADDFRAMLISSFGEFVVIPVNIVMIDKLGRKFTMASGFGVSSIFFFLLYLCVPKSVTTIFLFFIRAFSSGVFNTLYIYTSEVYPTTVRSLGVGFCSAMARFGSMSTPFVAQVIMPEVSVLLALFIYGGLTLVCVITSTILPIETKGRPLPQSVVKYTSERSPRIPENISSQA